MSCMAHARWDKRNAEKGCLRSKGGSEIQPKCSNSTLCCGEGLVGGNQIIFQESIEFIDTWGGRRAGCPAGLPS